MGFRRLYGIYTSVEKKTACSLEKVQIHRHTFTLTDKRIPQLTVARATVSVEDDQGSQSMVECILGPIKSKLCLGSDKNESQPLITCLASLLGGLSTLHILLQSQTSSAIPRSSFVSSLDIQYQQIFQKTSRGPYSPQERVTSLLQH